MSDVAFVALGSNIGDRESYIEGGRVGIAALHDCELIAATAVEETSPIGPAGQGAYLNQMIAVRSSLEPERLLSELHEIELRFGRARGERWGPRTLDLDIVSCGNLTIETDRLTIPHPAVEERPFWQRQLAQLRREISSGLDAGAPLRALGLPRWARVSPARLRHIAGVTGLLAWWATTMNRPPGESATWRAAGRWHDALRDAGEGALRTLTGDHETPWQMLHGPAAALCLERDGERRQDLLEAVRYHTVGSPEWGATGRALYMADFLEPGRSYEVADRAALVRAVPSDFDSVFNRVVEMRIEWAERRGKVLSPRTRELRESLR